MTSKVPSTESQRILVVEKDRILRNALQEALRTLGYEVQIAQDATQATELFNGDQGYGAVVADFSSATRDGLLEHLQSKEPSIPAVVLIPQGELYHRQRARVSGATAVVPKPVRMNTLRQVLQRVFSNSAVQTNA